LDWSRDGKYLLLLKNSALWYMSLADRQPKPLLQAKLTVRNAQFSRTQMGRVLLERDGHLGSLRIALPNADSKWQVSKGAVNSTLEAGRQGTFLPVGEGKMMAQPVTTGSGFEAGPVTVLFQTHARQQISVMDAFSYDVAGDGQRFLINTKVDESQAAPLSVILNWTSEVAAP